MCPAALPSSFRKWPLLPQQPSILQSLPLRISITSGVGPGTYGNLDAVIGEDERGVGASELGSRHGGRRGVWTDEGLGVWRDGNGGKRKKKQKVQLSGNNPTREQRNPPRRLVGLCVASPKRGLRVTALVLVPVTTGLAGWGIARARCHHRSPPQGLRQNFYYDYYRR